MSKNVLIPLVLLEDVEKLMYYLSSHKLSPEVRALCDKIENLVELKYTAMLLREMFSVAKGKPTEAEKEAAMQRYHDEKAKRHGFRPK